MMFTYDIVQNFCNSAWQMDKKDHNVKRGDIYPCHNFLAELTIAHLVSKCNLQIPELIAMSAAVKTIIAMRDKSVGENPR